MKKHSKRKYNIPGCGRVREMKDGPAKYALKAVCKKLERKGPKKTFDSLSKFGVGSFNPALAFLGNTLIDKLDQSLRV
jgi:hypothetical protein